MHGNGRVSIMKHAVRAGMVLAIGAARAQSSPAELAELGPEGRALAAQVGVWDVTETVWATPDARPVVTTGVAVRRMIGPLLEETLYQGMSSSDGTLPDRAISRIDYLSFNRLEGRWNYVSMDVRAAVGIMTANSFERDPASRVQVTFLPFAMPGNGPVATGQLLRMDEVIEAPDRNSTVKDQHFVLADGTGRKWLAHRYAYTRRVSAGK
ncbi:MAG: DUF1579 family protein [Luteibacter sp.]